jgi:hypothetical protein
MPPSGPVALPFTLAVAALTIAGQQTAQADAKIGVAAAVKNQVQGRAGAIASRPETPRRHSSCSSTRRL